MNDIRHYRVIVDRGRGPGRFFGCLGCAGCLVVLFVVGGIIGLLWSGWRALLGW
jgi:hypothetical protein